MELQKLVDYHTKNGTLTTRTLEFFYPPHPPELMLKEDTVRLVTRSYRFNDVDQYQGIRASMLTLRNVLARRDTTIIIYRPETATYLKVLLVVDKYSWQEFCNNPDQRYFMFMEGLKSLGLVGNSRHGTDATKL